ncbi:uncharacterized protein [Chelonus insularis]|uniref:uncharacterized protein isoform X2 n=1 Tax=Chelonus insularis TaxID=460826 RepID=UPI00158ADBA0|nr:uncharacterized protein LOC118069240 isoform X2 [Chelonus insularis]
MRYKSVNLLGYAALTLVLYVCDEVYGAGGGGGSGGNGGVCKDLQGHTYTTGVYYIPEPCTLCVCDNGNPKWCKAVICRLSQKSVPKQDCKSFRIGTPCCEFICLDDTLSSVTNDKTDGIENNNGDSSATYDLGLRLVASCITAILSLSLLFFLIHRLRQRKIRAGRQNRELTEEQRSLGSMGYLERGGLSHGMQMDEMSCSGGYSLWKPPGNYFPRGEAPPPYEEAVAAARAEQALLTMNPNALSSLNLRNSYLTTYSSHSNMSVAGSTQNSLPANSPTPSNYNATSPSSSVSNNSSRPLNAINPHSSTCHQQLVQTDENMSVSLYNSAPVTNFNNYNVDSNIYENTVQVPVPLPITNNSRSPEHSNVHENNHSQNFRDPLRHAALPRQGSAFTISSTLPNTNTISTHRTIPRTLTTSTSPRIRHDFINPQSLLSLANTPAKDVKSLEQLPQCIPSVSSNSHNKNISTEYQDNQPSSLQLKLAEPSSSQIKAADFEATSNNNKKPSLIFGSSTEQEGSFDSVTCTCSIQVLPTLHDDTDDYRSECENCKSTTGSRYYLDNEDELVTSPHETMTLHRRPEETASSVTPKYYRTSLTLPTSTRQRSRSTGTRGNWFSSMPESSTESSDNE